MVCNGMQCYLLRNVLCWELHRAAAAAAPACACRRRHTCSTCYSVRQDSASHAAHRGGTGRRAARGSCFGGRKRRIAIEISGFVAKFESDAEVHANLSQPERTLGLLKRPKATGCECVCEREEEQQGRRGDCVQLMIRISENLSCHVFSSAKKTKW